MKTFASHLDAISADRPTAVYRFYDAKGRLLYVGITFNLGSRFNYHQRHAPWWAKQDHVKVVWHEGREGAAAEERQAIRTERPISNIAGTRSRPAQSGGPQISPAAREAIARDVRGEIARYRTPKSEIRELLGLSRQSLAGRLYGRVPFRGDELLVIAAHLGVPIDRLAPSAAVTA